MEHVDPGKSLVSRIGERPSFLRLVRYIIVGLFVGLGLTLGATSLSGYRVVKGALQTVERGQGEDFLHAIERLTRSNQHSDEEIARTLMEHEMPRGLRCFLMFEDQHGTLGRLLLRVGECLTPVDSYNEVMAQQRRGELVPIGNRMRMVMGPPRRPPGQAMPRPPPPPNFHPPPGSWHPPPPHAMLIELEPQLADKLERSATRTLLSGGIAMVALFLTAAVFYFLSLREERARAAKERQRQLASLGEMAAVLAHELRNPMAALKGHAQLLLEQLPHGSRPHDKASRVVSEAERLESLSEDLLSFVRTTAIDPQPVNPVELMQECIGAVGDPRIELSAEGAPQKWRLDPIRMQQVLSNLLRNAVEASAKDGRVLAGVKAENGQLIMTVRDFGKGIREQELERIFEPFYTTRARGTGLGLAIARRLVSLHGGSISAENVKDGGALFRVALPPDARPVNDGAH